MTWPRLWCQYLTGYSSYCFVDLPPVMAEGSAVGEDVLEQAEDRFSMITPHHLRILCDVDGGMKERDALLHVQEERVLLGQTACIA